ncbi:Tn3 family transposase [Ensifer adhaerens]
MVKYAAAMQPRTAAPEAILRRFARAEMMHPTYKALSELGQIRSFGLIRPDIKLEFKADASWKALLNIII